MLADKQDFPILRLGTVKSSTIHIDGLDFGTISSWTDLYQNALSIILEQS